MVFKLVSKIVYVTIILFLIICQFALIMCPKMSKLTSKIICPTFAGMIDLYEYQKGWMIPNYFLNFLKAMPNDFINILIFFGYLSIIAELLVVIFLWFQICYYIIATPVKIMSKAFEIALKGIIAAGLCYLMYSLQIIIPDTRS